MGSGPLHPLSERLPVHVAHHEEHDVSVLFYRVDRHDVGVRQPGGRSRFAQEPLAQISVDGELWRQQLDGHEAIERNIPGQQHDPHATPAQLSVERVATRYLSLKSDEF